MNTYSNPFSMLLLLLLAVNPFFSAAQRPLEIDEIRVVAPYQPTISDAFKINFNPSIEDTTRIHMDFDYQIRPMKLLLSYRPEPITPARMRGEPLARIYRGQVKGGYGTRQSPYFEGHYNTLRSNEYTLGVHLKHRSSGEGTDPYEHSLFSHNKAHAYGTRFFRNTSLKAGAAYTRDLVHYYGFPSALLSDETLPGTETLSQEPVNPFPGLEATDIRQRYDFLDTSLEFGTHHADSAKANYHLGLGHQWLSDQAGASEHRFRFSGNFGRSFGQDPFGLAWKQFFELGTGADYFYNLNPHETDNTGIYRISPRIISYYDRLQFHLGVNLSVEDNNANYQLRAYPLAGFSMNIAENRLVAFMDLSGRLEKQSFRALSLENPFIISSPNSQFTNVRSEVRGGVRGAFGDAVSYNLSVINSQIDNQPFFVNNYPFPSMPVPGMPYPANGFEVVYDNIRRLNYRAEIVSRFGESFSLRLRGDFFEYTLDAQEEAWHEPRMLLSMNLNYNIQNKIILRADLYGRGKAYGREFVTTDAGFIGWYDYRKRQVHDFYLDANLGIEYRYTKLLSVFLNFYNIQNEKLERWTYYPTQGFNFLGGVTYAF